MAAAAVAPIMVTFLAAALVARQRKIVTKLRDAGATSPERATAAATFGGAEGAAFRILQRHAVLRATGERYYLDEPAWEALRARRHSLALRILLFAAVVVSLVLWIALR